MSQKDRAIPVLQADPALLEAFDRLLQQRLAEALGLANDARATRSDRQQLWRVRRRSQSSAAATEQPERIERPARSARASVEAVDVEAADDWTAAWPARHLEGLPAPVKEVPVKVARAGLSRLMTFVVEQDEVVVIRNGRRERAPGVVVMSEARAKGKPNRGGMNLAELVASFAASPIAVRSLKVQEQPEDAEPLRLDRSVSGAR